MKAVCHWWDPRCDIPQVHGYTTDTPFKILKKMHDCIKQSNNSPLAHPQSNPVHGYSTSTKTKQSRSRVTINTTDTQQSNSWEPLKSKQPAAKERGRFVARPRSTREIASGGEPVVDPTAKELVGPIVIPCELPLACLPDFVQCFAQAE